MRKKIILLGITLSIIIGAFLVYKINKPESDIVAQNTNSIEQIQTDILNVEKDITTSKSEMDPWYVFGNYLLKVKNHDIAGVSALSYKLSATCSLHHTR